MNKLNNKVAVVTGASKGIGASIAKGLAAEGAAVETGGSGVGVGGGSCRTRQGRRDPRPA